MYPTVVCLQVDNHSDVPNGWNSITRLYTSLRGQTHLCCVVPTATHVIGNFCYTGKGQKTMVYAVRPFN